MAKAARKSTTRTAKKSAVSHAKGPVNPRQLIESACVAALAKLQELELDYQLQSEINWCLGSFRNDRNPVGLFLMAQRALAIFKAEQALKTKGITGTLISDIQKALKSR